MGPWRYESGGGTHTVGEAGLHQRIEAGVLSGDTRVFNVNEEKWYRVDVDFPREFQAATYSAGRRATHEQQTRRGYLARNFKNLAFVSMLALAAGYWWWSSRITCSRSDVQTAVQQIVKEKILNAAESVVGIHNISTVGNLDNGGTRCEADVELTDAGSWDGLHSLAYTAETRGDQIYVTARFTK